MNPKTYWFARKTFGWGWTPASWQGWLVTGGFLAIVFLLGRVFPPATHRIDYFGGIIAASVLLLTVVMLKGEPRQGG